ncbi:aldehyde dehydrogenase family protein [Pseudarthrobacter sp. RMG13]|uniref:Aldehyde dehydrogenase family protein n=1 Tax=Pseudarthrobacter humi TaxID=2952523 RepID=A0ABT1LUA0_9MICC|nr:aldehyde dehydrogenase family protein [Pseudarthrobacter humi]MCP9002050.1 aldehyde dehydrogenase family protein [Pseudarthrobacter humi]
MTYGLVKNLVNGGFADAAAGGTIDVTNPATNDAVIAQVPAMTPSDLDSVFAAAEAGAKVWKGIGHLERGRILIEASRLIRARCSELVNVIVTEMGKTQAEATGEVGKSAEFFEYYGGLARASFGDYLPDGRPNTFASQIREPVGVVLLITPWNDPLLTPARKMAPALLAGNAVVIKPATVTPVIALKLAEILHDAGVPAGVLGTVTGRGSDIGNALLSYGAIKAVSFTGSTEVGLGLQRRLAGTGVRLQTEMGGKNAVVVLEDADLDLAVPAIVAGAFAQAGQRCTATSRLIVQRGVEAEVVEKVNTAVRALRVAAGNIPGADLGPVVSREAQRDVQEHVAKAIAEGAQVLAVADAARELESGGSFVQPTFLRIARDSSIWREEVFGPVLSMIVVDTPEEAIEAVNDSSYGLSSAVFTKDLARAFQFVEGVDTGQVSVNQPTTGWDIHHPFGGFKESGSAFKEQGTEALNFYSRTKTVAIRTH